MAKKRFDSGEKRPIGGRPIGASSWTSKVLNNEQPPSFAKFSVRDDMRKSLQSIESEEVEMQDSSRPPRSQADWVSWAMNNRPGDSLLGHTSIQGSSDGGMNFGYGTFSGDEDADDNYGAVSDEAAGKFDDSEGDDDETGASDSDYIFLRHRGDGSLISDA